MNAIIVFLVWASPVAIGVFATWDSGMVNPAMWEQNTRVCFGVWSAGCLGFLAGVAIPEDVKALKRAIEDWNQ